MLQLEYIPYSLKFRTPSGTSRGVLTEKPSWIVRLSKGMLSSASGIGECSIIKGLSPDPVEKIPDLLDRLSQTIQNLSEEELSSQLPALTHGFPAVQFALETALLDLTSGGDGILFDTPFSRGEQGIPINGLIWMGSREEMVKQVAEKSKAGFKVLKMKVGAIDFEEELAVIQEIRKHFSPEKLEIRLDANGAWDTETALKRLHTLSSFSVHSLEQPIAPGNPEQLKQVCKISPIPIALDEELIGIECGMEAEKRALLEAIGPQYIILKPSLVGGIKASSEWIELARSMNIGWWITSALESNIGLNAIAQWASSLEVKMPQGLGTGGLFTNNFTSAMHIKSGELLFDPTMEPVPKNLPF